MQKKAQKLSFGDQCFMYLGMEARTDFFFFFWHLMYTHTFMVILFSGMLWVMEEIPVSCFLGWCPPMPIMLHSTSSAFMEQEAFYCKYLFIHSVKVGCAKMYSKIHVQSCQEHKLSCLRNVGVHEMFNKKW